MQIRTIDTDDGNDLAPFLALPAAVYDGDPRYCPSADASVIAGLRRPIFWERQRVLLVSDGDKPVARLVARLSPVLRDDEGLPIGVLGFYEALDVPDAARRVLDEGVRWLRENGAGTIVGPMDGDTWHRYRLNLGPHDAPPFLMEPYNPPYYEQQWRDAGFSTIERYYSKRLEDIPTLEAALAPKVERALSRGYSLRPFRLDRYDEDMEIVHRISCEIFAGNAFYSPISLEEFLSLYAGVRALLDPELVWFAHASGGEPVGFLFAYPDLLTQVAAMHGLRRDTPTQSSSLEEGGTTTVNFKTLGLVPSHRRTGLDAALTHRVCAESTAKGYTAANLCLIRRENRSGALVHALGQEMRTYVLLGYEG